MKTRSPTDTGNKWFDWHVITPWDVQFDFGYYDDLPNKIHRKMILEEGGKTNNVIEEDEDE